VWYQVLVRNLSVRVLPVAPVGTSSQAKNWCYFSYFFADYSRSVLVVSQGMDYLRECLNLPCDFSSKEADEQENYGKIIQNTNTTG